MQNIKVDYNNMMAEMIGEKQGISNTELSNQASLCKQAYEYVKQNRGKGMMGWCELPYNQQSIVKDIVQTAESVRKNFEYFVVLGIGGSALGPMAVFNALCHLHYNDLPQQKRKAPKFYVEDNIDPERMQALLDVIDIKKTMFNVVTKSGATSETMAQYLIIVDLLKKAVGEQWHKHIIATTDQSKGNLVPLVREFHIKSYVIPDSVGGRFSELCPVGLLPAAVLGIDISAMLQGAAQMDQACMHENVEKNPALMSALLQYISMKRGKNISVMMPYADSLKLMADWYCQLWAESLGKAVDYQGKEIFAGQTPVKSLGVTDQHSQVQLYAEGPFDKVVTFIGVEKFRYTQVIANGCENIADVSFLGGHTMNELIDAERKATEYALVKAQRANYTIMMPEVTAHTIGQLIYLFEMQTAFCGAMLNLNTYNQPGVEEGKNAAYALLGKSGYEKKQKELAACPKKNSKYVIA